MYKGILPSYWIPSLFASQWRTCYSSTGKIKSCLTLARASGWETGLEKSFQYYSPRWKWTESFSRQSGSIAEISVAKSTSAEKCTTGVFLKWLFDWLAYLSQSGKLSSCKCRPLYEAAHEKRYLMAFSGKYEKNPNWKTETHVDDWCAAQTDSHNACDISSAPLSSDAWSRKENLAGKAPRPRGWIYSQTRSTRSERPTPLHLGPTKTATHLARPLLVLRPSWEFDRFQKAVANRGRT